MRQVVKRGLPFAALEALVGALGLENDEDIAAVTGMALRTLARRKGSRTLSPEESASRVIDALLGAGVIDASAAAV